MPRNSCMHEFIQQGGDLEFLRSLGGGRRHKILDGLNRGHKICTPCQCYIYTHPLVNNEHSLNNRGQLIYINKSIFKIEG